VDAGGGVGANGSNGAGGSVDAGRCVGLGRLVAAHMWAVQLIIVLGFSDVPSVSSFFVALPHQPCYRR
jgi:hypothetical protein